MRRIDTHLAHRTTSERWPSAHRCSCATCVNSVTFRAPPPELHACSAPHSYTRLMMHCPEVQAAASSASQYPSETSNAVPPKQVSPLSTGHCTHAPNSVLASCGSPITHDSR
jgi:hypothetical protein